MTESRMPKPRNPQVVFTDVPKKWFADSIGATQIANGVNLLFPAGERFFVRSVRHYLDRIEDPVLKEQVRGFFGQEGRHAQAHERFFDTMRAHGYAVDELLVAYEKVAFGLFEKRLSPALRLSVTVALEHFTAILAEDALAGNGLAGADPAMRRLLQWHAVEELEHKSVAFDVLAAVHPSYALRIAGLVCGSAMLGAFWVHMTKKLLEADGLTFRDGMKDLARTRKKAPKGTLTKPIIRGVFLAGMKSYLRRDFHPNDVDHSAIVEETLARLMREGVIPDEGHAAAAE